jgi:hypothetical protein
MLYNDVNKIASRRILFISVWKLKKVDVFLTWGGGDTHNGILLSPGVVLRITLIPDGRTILSWISNMQDVLKIRRILWTLTAHKGQGTSSAVRSPLFLMDNLALQVRWILNETVKYGHEFCGIQTRVWLLWKGPEASVRVNYRPILLSETAPHIKKPTTIRQKTKIWSWSPDGSLIQWLTGGLTVGHKFNLNLSS